MVRLETSKDKYGRSTVKTVVDGVVQFVRVTLPKVYTEQYGHKYLVNHWTGKRSESGATPVFYFASLKEVRQKESELLALAN